MNEFIRSIYVSTILSTKDNNLMSYWADVDVDGVNRNTRRANSLPYISLLCWWCTPLRQDTYPPFHHHLRCLEVNQLSTFELQYCISLTYSVSIIEFCHCMPLNRINTHWLYPHHYNCPAWNTRRSTEDWSTASIPAFLCRTCRNPYPAPTCKRECSHSPTWESRRSHSTTLAESHPST